MRYITLLILTSLVACGPKPVPERYISVCVEHKATVTMLPMPAGNGMMRMTPVAGRKCVKWETQENPEYKAWVANKGERHGNGL